MTSKFRSIVVFSVGTLFGMFLIAQCAFKDDEQSGTTKYQAQVLPKLYLPEVPKQASFAGESVPLDRWEVHEAFDRELIYNYNNPGHISYILKLSKRYFPLIEERLKANNIPDDFKYLCVAESNLQNLISKVGATGFWQFMKTTGPGYNLQISEDVDERYEVRKSTDAACKYLKQAYDRFGSWTAAAASYNCGMGGYNAQATFQQSKYYYDLQLPEETNKYIFRILSFKELMSNAKQMGYMVTDDNGYRTIETRQVVVTSSISNLAQWAIDKGTTYKMVKLLNPWLRNRSLSVPAGKSYTISLPAGK
ncbi:lytic transglycosylase domain-containing protein [Segetibacter sp. 3557_3]|uniref:lytic transglycosylase domain-containing protein n=1 Tax=Segetibacter sp. 3557_3 TaxID=2547429 RepID=UPI0010585703|nr:lytic transglycosylase domain-containing protein [Segetibacter sp. 3557_3]TDH25539.1 lytic transglycosylase domain-containing protein [Segetibacter sp. 3557_3]